MSARLTLPFLAGLMGMSATSTEDQLADALDAALSGGREAKAHAAKLEADITALNARVAQAESARDAAILALESIPPAPKAPMAPEAKYKAGDKVLYRGGEKTVKSAMGPEIVYEFEDGTESPECGPESRCKPMDGAEAKAFTGNLKILNAFAARVPGHTVDAAKMAALAMASVTDPSKMADAFAQIEASVPKNAAAHAANRAALSMLQPSQGAKPVDSASSRQAKIRNRTQQQGGI